MISIIVAFDEDRCIAKGGNIPWHISEDFKHFKKSTLGCPVVMGRKTWDSLPSKPLLNRTNIVISRNSSYTGLAFIATSVKDALQVAEREAPGKEVWVIGGEQVYKEALTSGMVDRIVASHINGRFGGDQFFPELPGWNRRLVQTFKWFEVYEYTPGGSHESSS